MGLIYNAAWYWACPTLSGFQFNTECWCWGAHVVASRGNFGEPSKPTSLVASKEKKKINKENKDVGLVPGARGGGKEGIFYLIKTLSCRMSAIRNGAKRHQQLFFPLPPQDPNLVFQVLRYLKTLFSAPMDDDTFPSTPSGHHCGQLLVWMGWWISQSMTCISIFLLPAQCGRKGGKASSEGQGNSPGVTQTWNGHREMAWCSKPPRMP